MFSQFQSIHNLSFPSPLCAPPASLLFCEPFPFLFNPSSSFTPPLHAVQTVAPSPPLCPMSQSFDMNYQPCFIHVRLALPRATLCSFLQSALFPPFSSLFPFPNASPCSSLLLSVPCSIFLSQPPKLSSLCPQCLVSVRRASSPAQMVAASPGAGSAMGTTTVLTVQTR